MEVGDYVRTEDGKIAKVIAIEESLTFAGYEKKVTTDKFKYSNRDMVIIKKSSSNIIDLIKRFDLVNGHLVICKMYENEKNIPTIVKCVGEYYFKEEDIKSIVTKEQFESMEYKVKE